MRKFSNTLLDHGEALERHPWKDLSERMLKNEVNMDLVWKGYHLMRDLSNLRWKQYHENN